MKDIVDLQYPCQFAIFRLFLEHVISYIWTEVLQQQYVQFMHIYV